MFLVLSLNRHKTVPSAAVTAIFVLAGCSARKPIAPPYAPFRLESVRGDSVLLTPPIPEGKNECALVKLTLKSSPAPSGVHCSAERGHFRVEQANNDPSSVHITLPALATWLGSVMWTELGSLLDRKSTRLNSSHVEISYAVFS